MTIKTLRIPVLVSLMLAAAPAARSQYYDWGQDPASMKWESVRTPGIKYIFPDTYRPQAMRLMQYIDTMRPEIGYGFRHGPMKGMRLVVHGQNLSPNGIVMLAPRRMEFITTPPASTFAFPHLKQLAAHEYRHTVHYNNTNRGLIRGLSWVLGQQASFVGMAFLPQWAIEGDAVMNETQMSTFGRALQPSFTIEYRAMALEGDGRRFAVDKYFSGSYRDKMPDHYQLGYQMIRWAWERYDENILDKIAIYSSRNPYLILPTGMALKKYYGTSQKRLFRQSFADLYAFWRSQPLADNSSDIVNTPTTSYTTYTTPVAVSDTVIVALKQDMDRYWRLVSVNTATGAERTLCHTGTVHSGLSHGGGMVWWTEYRQSTFWQQRINSQLCSYDLLTGRRETYPTERRVMHAAAMPDRTAAVSQYNYDGTYTLRHADWALTLPDTVSLHGLAWEEWTARLYFIALSDAGMWIGSARPGDRTFDVVTRPGYTSIADLSSGWGRLYFTSIASGRDEGHMWDLAESREYRVTASRYGSFAPAGGPGGDFAVMTTYTPRGYLLATQPIVRDSLIEVEWRLTPTNTVNLPAVKWGAVNLDRVKASAAVPAGRQVKRYRRGLHMFDFHSWAPVDFDPEQVIGNGHFNVRAGATLLSQNVLGSAMTTLRYGRTDAGHNLGQVNFKYLGWAPKIEVDALWADASQLMYNHSLDAEGRPYPDPGRLRKYFDIRTRVYLPMLLASGYFARWLTPSIEVVHNNALVYSRIESRYMKGLDYMIASVRYSGNARLALRDFMPRWGYAAEASLATNPFNDAFNEIWTFSGQVYTPGVAPHHSLMLRGAWQIHKLAPEFNNFRMKDLFPRGARFYDIAQQKYSAVSLDYQLPLCYPDGGVPSLLYFRRVRLNAGLDWAHYKTMLRQEGRNVVDPEWREVWSYGAVVTFDLAPLRLPASKNTTVSISVFKPNDRPRPVVGVGVTLPI